MKHVYTVQLYRPNRHWQETPGEDVFFIIKVSVMAFLWCVVAWMVML